MQWLLYPKYKPRNPGRFYLVTSKNVINKCVGLQLFVWTGTDWLKPYWERVLAFLPIPEPYRPHSITYEEKDV